MTLVGPQTISARVVDSLTGVYAVTFTPEVAGTYAVHVGYNRLPIFGSPYTSIVVPGRAHAPSSIVGCAPDGGAAPPLPKVDASRHRLARDGGALVATAAESAGCAALVGVAGEINRFDVVSRDAQRNKCIRGGEKVEAQLMLPPPSWSESALMRTLRDETRGGGVKLTVLDPADGSYAASYSTLAAGRYELSVTINSVPIAGSPFATLVTPGATCARNSRVGGFGTQRAVAGMSAALRIDAVDCYGNPQTAGGDPFTVTLTRPGVPLVSGHLLDHRNGSYSATYNATVSGLWLMHVAVGEAHAIGSPFSILVAPGATSARASVAVGEGTHTAAIGEQMVVLVRTKDAHGNDRAVGGDHISATLTQASTSTVVHAHVHDTRDGSYTLTYRLTLSALPHDYLMAVRVNNASLGGSPFRVRARPGPTVCEESLSVDLPKCVAGAVSEAPIFAKDRMGNQRTSGGDVFTAALELLEPPYTNESVQVGDNGDGTYRALYVVTRAARHRLWVAGACGAIKGSPYEVHCAPAALSVTHSLLEGRGAVEGVAGAATPFRVKARDVFDNTLIHGHYTWGARLASSAAEWHVRQDPTTSGGAYDFTYNVTRAGTYYLLVGALGHDGRVNGSMQVQGSPSTVVVRPGPLCGRRSKVFGPTAANNGADGVPSVGGFAAAGAAAQPIDDGIWREGAGRPVRLWVEARDAFDNAHEMAIEPSPFAIRVVRKGGSAYNAAPTAIVRAASRGGAGAYTADFTLPETGDYAVYVTATAAGEGSESGPLLGSPYPLRIVAGPTSAFQSNAMGGGLDATQARVGALQFVVITARDMYGNARSFGGDRFALTLDGPNGTRLVGSSMVDYANGTFVGSYLATVAGNYSVRVQRADEAGIFWDIKGSPFKVRVASGPTNPFISRLVGSHEVVAGEQSGFTLMSRDEFGNSPLGGERHRFDVSVVSRASGRTVPVARLYDAGKGNYTVVHVFTDAGEYSMRTQLLGSGGGTLPDFPLRVVPGPLSPPHSELLWPCHTPACVDNSRRREGYFVGWPVRFAVVPYDAYGNRKADGGRGVIFVARVHGPRPTAAYNQLRCAGESGLPDAGTAALHCRGQQHADGLYVVEFVPLVRGEFVVNVSVHGGAYAQRKLGNLPGSMVVRVDAAPVATCQRFRNCTAHGHCDYMTGRCVCDAGFDGDDCSHGAAARRRCPNDCSGHGYCSDETDGWGRNLCRCAVDYSGADCATWVTARGKPLSLGPECPNECSGHGACNATSGECACEPGYAGDDCSVSNEHHIVPLAFDSAGKQLILDFAPSTRRFAVHSIHVAVDANGRAECAGVDARPLCSGTWPVVLDAHAASWRRPFLFASLGGGLLLQYEPTYGAYLLLGCSGDCDGGMPCSRRLAAGRCSQQQLPLGPSMRATYLGADTVLFHNGATGAYTVHRLARDFLEQATAGCMFDPPLAAGAWAEIGVHRFSWLGVGDLLVDYEPARGNYTLWTVRRGAQADEDLRGAAVTHGHLMATSKAFVTLGDGLLMLASDETAPSGGGGARDTFGDGSYAMWRCSTSAADYSPHAALPCTPIGHADGLGTPHVCPTGCAADDCSCATKGSCVAQAGCGWCADTAEGMCMPGASDGPGGGDASGCFAWSYSMERTAASGGAAAPYEPHSYVYVERSQLLDYAAADGGYRLWNIARPPRPGCPGVEWPPAAVGTLAVVRHALSHMPSAAAPASYSLLDYDPLNGEYRLGACDRAATDAAHHLHCRTGANGTWHTGGLQLLWVGGTTVMRYSKLTGQYTLWRYHADAAASAAAAGQTPPRAAFDSAPIGEGALLRSDGQRLRGASLTYLDAGELLATEPTSGHIALYRRALVPAMSSASNWGLTEVDEAIAPAEGYALRWEASSVLRGWQFAYVGAQTLMMLKPAGGTYRLLNCSAVYTRGALPPAAAASGIAGGPPCSLLAEGTLPEHAPCNHTREHCLLAPHCGWCESSSQCVAASEDGVCFGSCPGNALLYGMSAPGTLAGPAAAAPAAACPAQLSCERCAEQPECAWCAAGEGGSGLCLGSADAAMGECATGRFVQYDPSACGADLVESAPFAGLVSQAR